MRLEKFSDEEIVFQPVTITFSIKDEYKKYDVVHTEDGKTMYRTSDGKLYAYVYDLPYDANVNKEGQSIRYVRTDSNG